MPPDLGRELRDAAPTPSRPLDMATVWAEARGMQRRRRIMIGAAAASMVIVVVLGATVVDFGLGDPVPDPAIAPTTTDEPTEGNRLELLAARLQSQRTDIRGRLQQLLEVERTLRSQLRSLRSSGATEQARQTLRSIRGVEEQAADLQATLNRVVNDLRAIEQRMTVSRRCPFPRFRPTYLPWQPEGPIPPPRKSYDHTIDRAQLLWLNPDDPDDGVAVTVYPLDGGATPEQRIGVRLDGARGYLHRGSTGEHSAWWDLDARCNFLELSVSVDELSPRQLDEEVVRVARSLE